MKRTKRIILLSIPAAIIILIGCVWLNYAASYTKIAFVNYQPITLSDIGLANNNRHIKISTLSSEDIDKAHKYDMVFVNGMGLRLTEEQRTSLSEAADKGVPVLTTASTNPDNLIISLDSIDTEFLKQYILGGGRQNYRSMLNYVRKFIDNKKLFISEISDPLASPTGTFYHPDPKRKNGDMLYFDTLRDYEKFLINNGKLNNNSPRIILTGPMGVPEDLIISLESTGNIVYPVADLRYCVMKGIADSISANAVINMAHGRMGDAVVEYLSSKNIPLFSPLNVIRDYDEWINDKMGMSGGFMSQSIVTPEIDGAVRPWALFAQYKGKDGLPVIKAIPRRLEEFVETVNNYISLQSKPNNEKKIAIFYFKGPGQNVLTAEGMDVAPSLYNFLVRLKREGYNVSNLPENVEAFTKLINKRGKVFGNYAKGEMQRFVKECSPELIQESDYSEWTAKTLSPEMIKEITAIDGPFPGTGLHTEDGKLALAALQFGNVVLLPQTAAGIGDDSFKIVHGTNMAPPHAYVGQYLWAKHGFNADALLHFGAHGSLEFTPRKQMALSDADWSDRLIGSLPHFYFYSTGNVGEAMTAKRRSYAGIVSYLTPPFMESGVRGIYKNLSDAVNQYENLSGEDNPNANKLSEASLKIKKYTVELGIHRELKLDSILSKPYNADEIARISNFAEELANEKITGSLYTMGVAYPENRIASTVSAMTVDPIAYSLFSLDRLSGKVNDNQGKTGIFFSSRYLNPARQLVNRLLSENRTPDDNEICRIAGISKSDIEKSRKIIADLNNSKDLFSRLLVASSSMSPGTPTARLAERDNKRTSKMKRMMKATGISSDNALDMARKMGADSAALEKMKRAMQGSSNNKKLHSKTPSFPGATAPEYSQVEIDKARAISEIERAIGNVTKYATALRNSPDSELKSMLNALSGGFINPTSGGDPVLNPSILPTGRNMFAINAEETPSVSAWEKGKALAENTIKQYRRAHADSLPRKVSYTLWSSEFIETEGATIAQALYMLGAEPVRDSFGRVTDIRLIPSKELGRPRIDVVVQTSGQLRDLAASRLFLISKAVEMASKSDNDKYPNYVREGVMESERHLVDKGMSPKEARELSTARVFGGINGNYGSGIREMVEAGDKWENASEIADTYLHNMGAIYESEDDWEKLREYAFEAALTRTDVVVQPRQSNTWGALSLDHVYEFMGGLNLAVRNVTGKEPEAYLSDYRNRNNAKMQEVKEAIGIESRTTILNPAYIKERMKGGQGDAAGIADVIRNTYGWNVMKPEVIDNELWDNIYDTYVKDKEGLGTVEYFKSMNPAALQEITAVMLETVRKGMWDASADQIATLANLHTNLVNEYNPSCSGFVCNNSLLRDLISKNVDAAKAKSYNASVAQIRNENINENDGMVMQKEELNPMKRISGQVSGIVVAIIALAAILGIIIVMRRRKKNIDK